MDDEKGLIRIFATAAYCSALAMNDPTVVTKVPGF